MGRHILRSDAQLLVSVGWADQRNSYFASVLDRTRSGADQVLVALGHKGSPAITTPTVVLDAVRAYAPIPDGLMEQLTSEATSAPATTTLTETASGAQFSHAQPAEAWHESQPGPDAMRYPPQPPDFLEPTRDLDHPL